MVRLVPMLESDFGTYLEKTIPSYAADNVEAGYWLEKDAMEKSRKVFNDLLPDGVNTKNQYLFNVEDAETNQRVGMIWMNARTGIPRPSGFIYEIAIDEEFRGKGYGKQAMLAIEEKARELNLKAISLHVFSHNKTAISLYEKIGYKTKSQNLSKELD